MADTDSAAAREPLAVIGLSCLFPKASGVDEFWSNIRCGVDAITEIPATHWDPDAYFDADPKAPDKTYARRGGFLSPVDFDPLEFGIAPSNLEAIDTSQLLGLVGAKRALDDAGYGAGRNFDRSRIGCILGVTGTLEMVIPLGARLGHPKWRQALKDAGVADDVAADVIQRIGESYVPWQENSFPGLLGNVVAGRIANRLDLGGTNCVVDAACASSLSAMHLAALELWSGRADMVVTGGIDTFNDIFMYMCFSKTPALSPTGDAKPFSEHGDGTILGEGVGMVVLKRLRDAERDGDKIYALIRGIGTSSDGAGNAVYAPKKEGQVRCLQDAYRSAGVSPATVELIEAHGTGTKVGDATELAGLTEVFQSTEQTGRWCAVGSIKSQIGHTKAAAGAAGVLKAILALDHRVLPPTIKLDAPLPALKDDSSPLYANTHSRPWLARRNHPRRAGVSAFGFGGSNFHCVLEESPVNNPGIDWGDDVFFAAWSADSREKLATQLNDWQPVGDRAEQRRRAAQTRAQFDVTHAYRLVIVADADSANVSQLVVSARKNLATYADRAAWSTPDGIYFGQGPRAGKLGLLFPGQGSQYVNMQRELACRFPLLQDVLTEANDVFAASTDRPLRLSDYVYPFPAFDEKARDRQEAALRDTEIAQPALGAVSLGLLAVLSEFGVRADVVAGHSYGELTALCASKRFAPDALYRLSLLRGRLMAEAQEIEGGMLAVGAPLNQVEAALKEAAVDLVIANRNSPTQVVLSGRVSELDRADEVLTRRKIRGKRLPVAAAFHSPLVAAASSRFRPVLDEIEFRAPEIPVYANTHAEEYPLDADEARTLLAGQLAQPVEFVRQIENMYAAGVRTFVEVGPGAVLTGLVGSILSGREFRAIAVDASAGRRSGMLDMALALGQLAVAGVPVNVAAWHPLLPQASSLQPQASPSPRLTIPICGANYVKPRTPKPPRIVESPKVEGATRKEANGQSNAPVPTSPPRQVSSLKPQASTPKAAGVTRKERPLAFSQPPTSNPPPASLHVLQQMFEQTARLHQQFLTGQEQALATLERLAGGSVVQETVAVTPVPAVEAPRLQPPVPVFQPAAVVKPANPAPLPTPAAPPTAASNALSSAVLQIVSEKTGYPTEMLRPEMSLDHDLGIDSIKRVEILSALQERHPYLPAVTPDQLGTLHRLDDVIQLLSQANNVDFADSPPPSLAVSQSSPEATLSLESPRAIPLTDFGRRLSIASGATFLITDDGGELSARLSQELQRRGFATQVVALQAPDRSLPDHLAGLILIAPCTGLSDTHLWNALHWTQVCGSSLRHTGGDAVFATISRLDGRFGFDSAVPAASSLSGALAGLAKTVRHEWPGVTATAFDISTDSPSGEFISQLADRLLSSGPAEIGFTADGWTQVELDPRDVSAPANPPIQPGDLVLVTGGARGVTAACALAVANAWRPRLVLCGRTPLATDEPAWLDGRHSAAQIKSALAQYRPAGTPLRQIDQECRQILANREVNATLASLQSSGVDAEYLSLDLRDSEAVAAALSDVQRQYGPLRGVVHGAGVLEDRRIEDKTHEQFGHVFATKIVGLRNVLASLEPDELRFLALFSSSTGRFGRTGQVDYAMANEALNKLAAEFQMNHPRCRTRSFNWGPWNGGMVTDSLKPLFAKEGIGLIPLDAGADLLVRELERETGTVELVVLAKLAGSAQAKGERQKEDVPASPSNPQPPTPNTQLTSLVLDIVSEKTGYPVEMLKPEMSLDHDLGIDSIKRVEILSALQERRPELPAVTPEQLQTLHRLADVIALLEGSAPAEGGNRKEEAPAAHSNSQHSTLNPQLSTLVLDIVAEKTGYPVEMLRPEMSLDHDLGIDSIKRVEILSALQERRPELPAVTPEQLQTLHRLADVIALLAGNAQVEGGRRKEEALPTSALALPLFAQPATPNPQPSRSGWERTLSVAGHPYLASHVLGGKAVLPTAMILEILAHAAMHHHPGLEFAGLSNLRIFKGVRLDWDERLVLRALTDKAVRQGSDFQIPTRLAGSADNREVHHAEATISLSATRRRAAESRLHLHGRYTATPVNWYNDLLFHGSLLQGLVSIERLTSEGIVVQAQSAPPPTQWLADAWRGSWLADPLAIDVLLQAIIVWTQTVCGRASLPTAIGSYRQFQRTFPADGVRVAVRAERKNDATVVADAEILDARGTPVADFAGIEYVLDAQLTAAFGRNRFE